MIRMYVGILTFEIRKKKQTLCFFLLIFKRTKKRKTNCNNSMEENDIKTHNTHTHL